MISCRAIYSNEIFERASTLNGLALSMSHVIDKLEFGGEINELY